MSGRPSGKRAAIYLQRITGWTIEHCDAMTRAYSADVIEHLAKMRGKPIDRDHEDYERWRRRARRARQAA